MVDTNGYWNWHLFEQLLPNDILLCIVAVKPPNPDAVEDSIGWRGGRDRHFTLKSAYLLCANIGDIHPNPTQLMVTNTINSDGLARVTPVNGVRLTATTKRWTPPERH
ncbi:hypothetical protein V6N12_062223 [Hibiscus sabdariffa]|uniref:Uncharacterized protein n=1 Tax=Hibiscus sabdariffa TaxID=183260 RepID=A0ABR2F881_9ROSI